MTKGNIFPFPVSPPHPINFPFHKFSFFSCSKNWNKSFMPRNIICVSILESHKWQAATKLVILQKCKSVSTLFFSVVRKLILVKGHEPPRRICCSSPERGHKRCFLCSIWEPSLRVFQPPTRGKWHYSACQVILLFLLLFVISFRSRSKHFTKFDDDDDDEDKVRIWISGPRSQFFFFFFLIPWKCDESSKVFFHARFVSFQTLKRSSGKRKIWLDLICTTTPPPFALKWLEGEIEPG